MILKVKFNIDENLPEEKAEFWLHRMTDKISQIANELTNKKELTPDTILVSIILIFLP